MRRTDSRLTRREALKLSGVSVASLVTSRFAYAKSSGAKPKPNIILVFTDDQGWTDTSVPMMLGKPETGSDFYKTPALEKMAGRGMVFSNAYSPAPTCTPSRGGVQFGKTPARLKQTIVHDVLAKVRGVDCKNEVALPQMIKAADATYITAHFGKWGFPPRSPEHAGYDVTDGNTNNGDGDWTAKKNSKPLPPDDPKRIFSITKRANAFMDKCVKASRPFFMQISHYAAHVQHSARPETVEKYRKAAPGKKFKKKNIDDRQPRPNASPSVYAAMIEDLDTGLGMVLDKLRQLGINENTYVIFTSDNGGGFRGNAPLKGGKANVWEGGLRVPTVICGPGVKPGAYCNQPIAGWDIYPTIADLIGNTKPLPEGLDGGSIRPLLSDPENGKVKRGVDAFVFHFPWYAGTPMSAIRVGDYKLVMHLNTGESRLFNLASDIGESNDLSESMPKEARKLKRQLKDYLKEVGAEDVRDMRAARRAELLEYKARTRKNIDTIRQSIKKASSKTEKEALKKKLQHERTRMKAHQNGLDQLECGRQVKSW
ncbi:MAG: sulfatase [Phycisphaerae bacterium]|nr:sulfatase [Phycisphaerae bacterium]